MAASHPGRTTQLSHLSVKALPNPSSAGRAAKLLHALSGVSTFQVTFNIACPLNRHYDTWSKSKSFSILHLVLL